MKKLIYSQEDVDLILALEQEEYNDKIEKLKEDTTMNIQDLFNERIEQNKRIEELSLALESVENKLDKIKEIMKKYKYTNIEDYVRIMKFYNELEKLLEEIE